MFKKINQNNNNSKSNKTLLSFKRKTLNGFLSFSFKMVLSGGNIFNIRRSYKTAPVRGKGFSLLVIISVIEHNTKPGLYL